MDQEDLLELLHLQIVRVQDEVAAQSARGEAAHRTTGLLRSLRMTLRAVSAGIDLDEEAASAFVLTVSPDGQMLLRRDAHLACLTGPFFRSLFELAGIQLEQGQVLLVEPEFARRAIEDSLGESLAEECRLQRKRANLQTALKQMPKGQRDEVLQALGQIDAQEADLLVAKVELAEMNASTATRNQ
jgi:hypothetical protein